MSELAAFKCLFPLWLTAELHFTASLRLAFLSVLLNGFEKVRIKKKKSMVQTTKVRCGQLLSFPGGQAWLAALGWKSHKGAPSPPAARASLHSPESRFRAGSQPPPAQGTAWPAFHIILVRAGSWIQAAQIQIQPFNPMNHASLDQPLKHYVAISWCEIEAGDHNNASLVDSSGEDLGEIFKTLIGLHSTVSVDVC